jgi:hypothetical protein
MVNEALAATDAGGKSPSRQAYEIPLALLSLAWLFSPKREREG